MEGDKLRDRKALVRRDGMQSRTVHTHTHYLSKLTGAVRDKND